jgi:hypothetical protein
LLDTIVTISATTRSRRCAAPAPFVPCFVTSNGDPLVVTLEVSANELRHILSVTVLPLCGRAVPWPTIGWSEQLYSRLDESVFAFPPPRNTLLCIEAVHKARTLGLIPLVA